MEVCNFDPIHNEFVIRHLVNAINYDDYRGSSIPFEQSVFLRLKAGGAFTFVIATKVNKKARLKKGDCALWHCIKF
jgi:hypothetical protein